VRDLPATIDLLSERLANLAADLATATAHAADPIKIGNHTVSHEDAPSVLGGRLDSLPQYVREARRVPVGFYRGLEFGLMLHPQFPPDVYLTGHATRQSMLSREHQGPRAVLNALERLASGYDSECARVRQDLSIAEAQLRDYQTRLGTPFAHDAYSSELTTLRDLLRAGLSGMSPKPSAESSSVSELAERVKALKDTHTIESASKRAGKRGCSVEEPVTTRIRRHTKAISAPDQD
jgi:hypothetical protein